MLAISLVFSSILTILFLILGIVIGWTVREYMMIHQEGPKQIAYHPEFYDKDGDLIDQEILSLRFEEGYFGDEFESNGDDDDD